MGSALRNNSLALVKNIRPFTRFGRIYAFLFSNLPSVSTLLNSNPIFCIRTSPSTSNSVLKRNPLTFCERKKIRVFPNLLASVHKSRHQDLV